MINHAIIPSADQVNQAKQAINAYIRSIDNHPERRMVPIRTNCFTNLDNPFVARS
jgi:hypothetical protein